MAEDRVKVVPSRYYLERLSDRYEGLRYREGLVRRWFCEDKKVFFDCEEGEEKVACLRRLLERRELKAFTVIFIVKRGVEGEYELMNASFSNIGSRTIGGFSEFYHLNLEFMTKLSLQARSLDYVECVGYSYID